MEQKANAWGLAYFSQHFTNYSFQYFQNVGEYSINLMKVVQPVAISYYFNSSFYKIKKEVHPLISPIIPMDASTAVLYCN